MKESNNGLKTTSTWAEALCLGEGPSSTFLIILWDLLLLTSMFSKITPPLMQCPGPEIALLFLENLRPGTWSGGAWILFLQPEEDFHVGFTGISAGTHFDPHGLK